MFLAQEFFTDFHYFAFFETLMLNYSATNAFLYKLGSIGIKMDSNDLQKLEKVLKADDEYISTITNNQELDISWSDEIGLFKNRRKKNITVSEIINFFKSLRLINLSIREIDSNFNSFQHLKELNLSGNLLSKVDNIPQPVEILDINANR